MRKTSNQKILLFLNQLEINNLHIGFETYLGTIQAVRGINFSLKRGEIIGLVGESGCGKSVTAHSIMGLLEKGTLIDGQILFEGENLLSKTEKDMQRVRGKKIGMIFQDPASALNPTMKIGNQIIEGLKQHENMSYAEAYQRTFSLLKQVGINDIDQRINQYPHELSGGMKQRILIAIALACKPSLLIADEPTTALDVTIQAQILDLLQDIQVENQLSLLLITHDLGIVSDMCDRVMIMYAGKIVEEGSINQIFLNPKHPYTQALLSSKRILHTNNKKSLLSIPGQPPNLLRLQQGCPFSPRCAFTTQQCKDSEPKLTQISSQQHVACWNQQEDA